MGDTQYDTKSATAYRRQAEKAGLGLTGLVAANKKAGPGRRRSGSASARCDAGGAFERGAYIPPIAIARRITRYTKMP
jgi:hypothetical protein